jgi:hypothetical protein
MGIALLTFHHLFAPLQAVVSTLFGPRTCAHAPIARRAATVTCVRPTSRVAPMVAARPLRVVRVLDPSAARNTAGRMVISGRLEDVCAELDRLAALESAAEDGRQAVAPAR